MSNTNTPAKTSTPKRASAADKGLTKALTQSIAQVTKAKKAAPAPAPEPVKRTHAPKGQGYANHDFERKSEDFPCTACGEPWLHAKKLCSKCYNAARIPMKQGKTGAALVKAVRAVRKLAGDAPVIKQPKARKPRAAKAAAPASAPAAAPELVGAAA